MAAAVVWAAGCARAGPGFARESRPAADGREPLATLTGIAAREPAGQAAGGGKAAAGDCFRPGQLWLDTDGKPIQAHGGGILHHRGVYYWFGENKQGPTRRSYLRRVDVVGVSCYSSTDLYRWKNEGLVLPAAHDDPGHDLHPSRVVERPKVIYNDRTNAFVMWMHIDTADYQSARTGVAVSDSPTGPYRYLGSFRPNGADSRDMTLFKDADGSAYLLYASEWNSTLHVTRLSDDYLKTVGEPARNLIGHEREAPAIFRRGSQYHLITSGCSGWAPNAADWAISDSVMGPWQSQGNPCVGSEEEVATTFHAQGTFVLPVPDREDAFIFMADRWNPRSLGDSRYVWLPIEFEEGKLRLRWRDRWDLSVFG